MHTGKTITTRAPKAPPKIELYACPWCLRHDALRRVEDGPVTGWTCLRCGTVQLHNTQFDCTTA
jgi:hypothetical protein